MMKRRLLTGLVLSLAMVFSIIFAPSGDPVYADQAYSLTVKFNTEAGAMSGSVFRAYRAFDASYDSVGAFADYPADLGDLGSEAMNNLAATLSAYAADHNIAADQEKTSDAAGQAYFGDLVSGLYLVTGEPVQKGDVTYTPKPFMVSVPYRSAEEGLVTDVVAEVKYDRQEIEKKTIDLSVEKVWADGDGAARPAEVKVRLLKDGELLEEVTLSQQTQWKHTWEKLDGRSQYQLTEENVPDGYQVSVAREGNRFVVTNRYQTVSPSPSPVPSPGPSSAPQTETPSARPEPPQSEVPGSPAPPVVSAGPSGGPAPTASVTKTAGPASSAAPSERLPQTGQLWWPVPIFLGAGILLVVAGRKLRDHEQ